MPIDYAHYPENWKELSRKLREEQPTCEWCGAPNGVEVIRDLEGRWYTQSSRGAKKVETDYLLRHGKYIKPVRIILTVAHLGVDKPDGSPGDKRDKMDVRRENLAVLCQRCHLNFDRADHIQHRKENAARRLEEARARQGWQKLL